ncbi:hypothetical protein ASPWEDRAFT_623653 [Aspergillus wentii DTO 134E9]|uniref:Zn(2)-C6 fungal-type domain-containing protein n=1 Tax=Aspergillus wentii DTO 134E9 TaxID=1073089 RepID=A0A1L9RF06_ASPWE|nr:uncharacterized protein ASPWEDRAFT_623653 [Aspergillus wentii DTO 134E9]OJJ33506.1 hypothetical protein ASPWEDRAFT_623653 [Aspergillus wentii DTO 134E9]
MPLRPTKHSGLTTVACTECRKQHLKCDAKRPSCSRCLQTDLPCQYVASRRGGRRKPAHHKDPIASSTSYRESVPPMPSYGIPPVFPRTPSDAANPPVLAPTPTNTTFSQRLSATDLNDAAGDGSSWLGMLPANDDVSGGFSGIENDDRLRRLYYENFHAAHPVLVPSSLYSDQNYPAYLQAVVHFVGSHYTPSGRTKEHKEQVVEHLASNNESSPATVQAWLIYAIVLNARNETSEAQSALTQGIDLALKLGMNRGDFASSHGEYSVEAESMRRTWWELHITEVHMALSLSTFTGRCSALAPDVALPCEESIYNRGKDIPAPCGMLDFKRRILAAEDPIFSSYSYRIEATMILGRVIVLNSIPECHRDQVQAAENALVSWTNHLPAKKFDIVDAYGNVDEMMFQAHLTIAYAAMLLHLPRSNLQPVLAQPERRQFWPGPSSHLQLSSTSTRLVHSIKATEASRQISDSISVCPNILKHSPFVIPSLSLCGMIQLATCTVHSDECFDHHCNRVNLILGCLKSARRTWELAESSYRNLRISAADLMSDSIERCHWNTTTLNPVILSRSASTDPTRPSSAGLDGQDLIVTDLPPAFFDRACFNSPFFTVVPGPNMI